MSPGRPLLFLDIDGVLNSESWARRTAQRGVWGVDPDAVRHLNALLERSDAAVVLSSTWRRTYGLPETVVRLEDAGLQYAERFIGVTPHITGVARGYEVNAWLSDHQWRGPFACLDDDGDFLPGQPLVQTSTYLGLTAEEVEACVAILRRGRCD